jgi:two-component system, LuxR family, sensor kinase FixL
MSEPARILIIEDEPDTRANLCDLLELFGLAPFAVASGAEALAHPKLASADVILLDRKLPDLLADDLLPLLRERLPDTDVIVATAHADLDGTIAALRHGAADYLIKPINPDALRISIERCLERKRLQREADQSRDAFQQLVRSAASVIVLTRTDRTIAWVNPFAEQFTGSTAEDLIGNDCLNTFLPHKDRVRYKRLFQWVSRGRTVDEFELAIECRPGHHRWLICNTRRLDDYKGAPAILIVGQDITARRDAEDQLRLLDAAITDLNEGVLISQTDETWFESPIVFANKALTTITGYSPTELKGQTSEILAGTQNDKQLIEELDRQLSAGHAVTREVIIERRDKSQIPVELHLSPVNDSTGARTHTVATLRDISERKLAEEQALQAERLTAIGTAMTGLAHESRNALQRSQASLDMLSAIVGNSEPDATKLIQRIQLAQDDLHRLYEDVREYARPIRVEKIPKRVDELLRQAWDELIVKRDNREARLVENAETDDLICPVEPFLIRQALRNILDNSLAASEDPVTITVTWKDFELDSRTALQVSLRDNGPGLTPDAREKLFNEFFTTKTHGTGLGLAIVKRFIDAHSGTLVVGDFEDGLELVITLPRG